MISSRKKALANRRGIFLQKNVEKKLKKFLTFFVTYYIIIIEERK